MPKGVEHPQISEGATADILPQESLMPKGVEHKYPTKPRSLRGWSAGIFDAERR